MINNIDKINIRSSTSIGRIIVGLQGNVLLPIEKKIIFHKMTAGVLLFSKNYEESNFAQLRKLITDIKNTAIQAGKHKLSIFVDQEGGHVMRFGRGFTSLPAAETFGIAYDINPITGIELAKHYGKIMATELMSFGVISFAPVVDLQGNNIVISGLNRAFHQDPIVTTNLAEAFIDGMLSAGMPATIKHFPGHGNVTGDTHLEQLVDNSSLEDLLNKDLIPFVKLIEKRKVAAITPAHIVFPAVDPDNTVVNSKIWLQDLLRSRFKFNGTIISDCLSMLGAGNKTNIEKTIKALENCDLAILSNVYGQDMLDILDYLEQDQKLPYLATHVNYAYL